MTKEGLFGGHHGHKATINLTGVSSHVTWIQWLLSSLLFRNFQHPKNIRVWWVQHPVHLQKFHPCSDTNKKTLLSLLILPSMAFQTTTDKELSMLSRGTTCKYWHRSSNLNIQCSCLHGHHRTRLPSRISPYHAPRSFSLR